MRYLILLLTGLVPVANAAKSEVADAVRRVPIVDRSIDHHGGDRFENSRVTLRLCSRSGCYVIFSHVDGGLYEHIVEGPAGSTLRRARITNDSVEAWQDGLAMEIDAAMATRIRDWVMARVYFVFLPYRLNDPSVLKEDLGIEVWGGRPLHRVKVTFDPGSSSGADDAFVFWFDPDSARLEQFAYSFRGDPGGVRFRRAYDYRRIGGILFFDQENLGLDGPGLSVDQIGPDSVSDLDPISKVTVEKIEVVPLAAASR